MFTWFSQFPSPGNGTQGALVALRGHSSACLGRAGHGGAAEPGAALVQEAGKALVLSRFQGKLERVFNSFLYAVEKNYAVYYTIQLIILVNITVYYASYILCDITKYNIWYV